VPRSVRHWSAAAWRPPRRRPLPEAGVSTFLWGTQFRNTAGNRSPIYNYWWTHAPPGTDPTNPIEPANGAGAYHGAEKYYLFGNLYGTDRPWTEQDYAIADTTSSYVANFVAPGNPNGRSLPAWPALRTSKPIAMELGDHFATLPAADSDAKYAFLKDYLLTQTTAY